MSTLRVTSDSFAELDELGAILSAGASRFDVRTVCEWVANKNFLSRRYTVSRKDKVELQGTQIVGWDANQKRIRSWFFDSDCSFGGGETERPVGRRDQAAGKPDDPAA